MTTPRIIKRPELKSASALTPQQLNAVRFSPHRTLLTPEQLEKLKAGTADSSKPDK